MAGISTPRFMCLLVLDYFLEAVWFAVIARNADPFALFLSGGFEARFEHILYIPAAAVAFFFLGRASRGYASKVPYMVVPGNHEAECHSPACLFSKRKLLVSYIAGTDALVCARNVLACFVRTYTISGSTAIQFTVRTVSVANVSNHDEYQRARPAPPSSTSPRPFH